jgi:hypothetical protein
MESVEENMGPPGPGSSQYGSRYSMSSTCGSRDIISLVIPRIGDNNPDITSLDSLPVSVYSPGEGTFISHLNFLSPSLSIKFDIFLEMGEITMLLTFKG